MRNYTEKELKEFNQKLKAASPAEIIKWALTEKQRPVVTTNFRPYEAAILHACTQVKPDIIVIWCDTGYNTPNTYKHANALIKILNLNVTLYNPEQTAAYRDAVMGGIPQLDSPNFEEFSRQVKLEPFKRAMQEQNPDVWFTNLRQGQTTFRNSIDILSYSKDEILKVSPFYYWNDKELDAYLEENELPNEFNYFDPTKVLSNRECGLHS